MENIISGKNIAFRYNSYEEKTPPLALDGVNIEIEKGSFVAILGHNGSGKSTLAKHFNGVLQPDEGDVLVLEMNTKDEENLLSIRQNVGMVFQNPDNQIVASIVEEDLAFGPENLGVPPEEIRKRIDNAMEAVGISDLARRSPAHLSGGQKQRVAIAGIIAMLPNCIVLDEPTAMLDPRGRKEVMDTIKNLNEEMGITIILITHYMQEATEADRVIAMNDGKIILDGTPKEVFREAGLLKSVGLDIPEATELAFSLKDLGIEITADILTVEECVNSILEADKIRKRVG